MDGTAPTEFLSPEDAGASAAGGDAAAAANGGAAGAAGAVALGGDAAGGGEGDLDAEAPAVRRTTPYLTKYERARVLGTRALQISMGAACMVALDGETDPLRIAQKELGARKVPIIVRRYLPDGSFEDWTIDNLIID